MSEYQYIAFQAVDRPLTNKQFAFAEKQSSRAELSRSSFNVEYHYSSFRGDVDGLLRNGYDVFLTYSNIEPHEVKLRLPYGLPFSTETRKRYIDGERLKWMRDRQGKGGILSICPYFEEGLEQYWGLSEFINVAVEVREQLIAGDLRALYLVWMCVATDDEADHAAVMEPPVPHGLKTFPDSSSELLDFFGCDPLMMQAAAIGIPDFALTDVTETGSPQTAWLDSLTAAETKRIVERLMTEDAALLKAEMVAGIRESKASVDWPCTAPSRTVAELIAQCESLRRDEEVRSERKAAAKAKREAIQAERMRQERIQEMKADPKKWISKAGKLVDARRTDNYRAAADILADLKEAVGGDDGDAIARRHAAHFTKKYPTLNILKSELKKRGLLGK